MHGASKQLSTDQETRRSSKIPSLDGLRAVSIVLVFCDHAGISLPIQGSSGVTVFFFLSGYLIASLLIREQEKAGRIAFGAFYLRRVIRIFPPMYIALALALILVATQVVPDHLTVGGVLATALHSTNYYIIDAGRSGLVSTMFALWSLAVEEHFYLFFPVLLLALTALTKNRRVQAAALIVMCILIGLWRSYLVIVDHVSFDRTYVATDTRADSILWGCALALIAGPLLAYARRSPQIWTYLLLPLAVVAFVVAQHGPDAWTYGPGYTIQALALAVVFVTVIALPRSWAGIVLNFRPVVFLGVLSYSFYVLHRMAIMSLQVNTHLGTAAVAACAFVISVAAAYVMHVAVERTCAKLRGRLSRAGEAQATGASPF
jgi:peptidoglycan/LPS O-acetylase OafA/YrhL